MKVSVETEDTEDKERMFLSFFFLVRQLSVYLERGERRLVWRKYRHRLAGGWGGNGERKRKRAGCFIFKSKKTSFLGICLLRI